MKTLSVIVPVYNSEKFLKTCLNSLVNQTLKDIEIIVVNDGSTDNSKKILGEYTYQYPDKVKYVEKSNGGLGSARNRGLDFVTGRYIAFVDSDDSVDLNLYEKIIKYAEKQDLDIVEFGFKCIYTNYTYIKKSVIDNDNPITYLLYATNATNKIFKSSLWTDSNSRFPNKLWYEDLAIIPTFFLLTNKVGQFPGELYYNYYMRSDSITNQKNFNPKCMDVIESLEMMAKPFSGSEYETEIEFRFIHHALYYTSQQIVFFKQYSYLETMLDLVNKKYPNWIKNKYIKNLPKSKKIYLYSIHKRMYILSRMLVILRNKLLKSGGN